ncbi:precorrin-6A/cobalt-precorrin-6A reductase [Synechococcus sp. CS-1329]|uniref:precorrin-6A/cobalt-precorrin-6A reductase n=1 Tax=Synechococcus sp. CS-1329 TaxID=2847975 RepID=UPI00223B8962|nr:precorrin-6A/cobalt-precorrin-6A reductase [Synechococcus sp. CS-1329]MCT0219716.1 precorrin-6A/cobalt-precorrin-6A reductase [Synechococcus sp. CS-1329]
MHGPNSSIWLLGGTGEGPLIAARLLAAGWSVQVSLVSDDALRAYAPHPRLASRLGALAGPGAIAAELQEAPLAPFRWVIDASHPFACRISADLAVVCVHQRQPLLRLRRPPARQPIGSRLILLEQLEDLAGLDLGGERLLLAIGARHLPRAVELAGAGACFARILPSPTSLRLALAAGLGPGALACHRPGTGLAAAAPGAIERALLLQWAITAVLCRQSGGPTEQLWQQLCAELGLSLLLLKRPEEPISGAELWPLEPLLRRVGLPAGQPPAGEGTPAAADPAG